MAPLAHVERKNSDCARPKKAAELAAYPTDADVERLWQLCINAEPNYGTLWFHCKTSVLLTTRQVLQSATELLQRELCDYRHVYTAAAARASSSRRSPRR